MKLAEKQDLGKQKSPDTVRRGSILMKRFLRVLLGILGAILAVLLVGPFLVPVPPLKGLHPPQEIAGTDSQYVEIDGLQIHYKSAGQGRPALLLLHGFAASLYSWREVMRELSQRFLTVAFDRPGFGLTTRPRSWTGENPYSQTAQSDQTIALMDQLGIEKAVLVGNSMGGAIAALTALRFPQRIQALVLVDPAIALKGHLIPAWVRPFLNTPQARHLGPLIARSIQNWGIDFARSAWHDPSKITPEIWEGYSRPLQVKNWDGALWEVLRARRAPYLEEHLDELTLPVLVITGDDDHLIPSDQSRRLAGKLPNAELVVIPNCGHIPQEECPQDFLQAVNDFLDKYF